MNLDAKNLNNIVSLIMKELDNKNNLSDAGQCFDGDEKNGIFSSMDVAVSKAKEAQVTLFASKLELRERIIKAIREDIREAAAELAEMAVEETGMGRVDDKTLKHYVTVEKTPGVEDLRAFAYSGDSGLTVMELSPYGVIGSITPSTNPSETIVCNAIGMIAAGNSVVFAPHPGAKKTSLRAVEIINKAVARAGGPNNLVVTISEPSIENTNKMVKNPDIKMVVATGGPGVVKSVMSSGKKAIGAGAGNPPVLVDETADIEKAAKDIVNGCSFDNNLPCITEKEVVAVDSITDYLIFEMQKNGAYLIQDSKTIKKLCEMVINDGSPNRAYVGKNASYILKDLGIDVGDEIKVIILETDAGHPLAVLEMLMPVLPIVRVKDALEGIKVCKKLEDGLRHTAMIHSKNIDILTKYARDMETTILVKNGPSYSGIGVGGEGYTTFTIAGPTGEGLTSAKSFARNRRCALVGGLSIK
ncbi:aldehyde dehydrogenase family protein [uncultured Ilyobacter sp.]|jgi:propionaldehyde dehydrogenase|uniref:aldehyde dehydrogenase family protein n=1 Tax=uncultured Ilyobacter sp. TaxID=544433 RepID=UPI002AA6BE8F|nr:aldehyde dehydrogenase family protein [uncultured Ilyobacter sp.]